MWIFLIVIAIAIVYFIAKSSNESGYIEGQPFDEKFSTFIDGINDKLMSGNGQLSKVDNKEYWLTTFSLKIQFIYRKNTLIVNRKQDLAGLNQNNSYTFSNIQNATREDQIRMIQYYLEHHYSNL